MTLPACSRCGHPADRHMDDGPDDRGNDCMDCGDFVPHPCPEYRRGGDL